MASSVHTHSKKLIIDNDLDLVADSAVKVMALKSTYDAQDDPDVDFVDSGGANDPTDHEADCTGYTGGFAGAGRKSVNAATPAWVRDDPNLRIEYDFADIAYGNLGTGVTIGMVVVIEEITSDAASNIIYADDLTANVPTNGGPITYVPDVEGMLQL